MSKWAAINNNGGTPLEGLSIEFGHFWFIYESGRSNFDSLNCSVFMLWFAHFEFRAVFLHRPPTLSPLGYMTVHFGLYSDFEPGSNSTKMGGPITEIGRFN